MRARQVLGSVSQACTALGVDVAGVWELVAQGHLMASRYGDQEKWTISVPYRNSKFIDQDEST